MSTHGIFSPGPKGWNAGAKIIASDGSSGDNFGHSVDISADGLTAVIGAYGDNANMGSIYVYNKVGSEWVQSARLNHFDSAGAAILFGGSVTISGDGNTIAAGATARDVSWYSDRGGVYIFKKINNVWVNHAVVNADETTWPDQNGHVACLNHDGTTLAFSSISNNMFRGMIYVFRLINNAWVFKNRVGGNNVGNAFTQYGYRLEISADGNFMAANCSPIQGDLNAGGGYIFSRDTNDVWSQYPWISNVGGGCGISGDGSVVVFGTRVYSLVNGVWVIQTTLATLDGSSMNNTDVALSHDGSIAAVSHTADNSNKGSVYIFVRTGDVWSQAAKLEAVDGVTNDLFGSNVSLSADGKCVLIGSKGDDSVRGSAYIFNFE
jgi:hypothetical protein